MSTEWRHVYDLKENDLIRVGPNGQLFVRVNNPLNPHEEVCAVLKSQPMTKEQRTIMAWLVRIASTYRAVANTKERSEIKAACAEAEKMME